jgi:hypothetical protein
MGVSDDDDGYGRHWDYRVFSQQWTCPDDWNVGQRYLTVHHVDYNNRYWMGTHDYPLEGDIIYIDHEPAAPKGIGMAEAMQDAERIMKAYDMPVMIMAEWQSFFDHSEKCERDNARRAVRYRKEARAHDRANRLRRQKLDQHSRELDARFKAESEARIAHTLKEVDQ